MFGADVHTFLLCSNAPVQIQKLPLGRLNILLQCHLLAACKSMARGGIVC